MARTYYQPSAADTRSQLLEMGIKEPMWHGFHVTCKFGPHIRRDSSGQFELTIKPVGNGYKWKLERV